MMFLPHALPIGTNLNYVHESSLQVISGRLCLNHVPECCLHVISIWCLPISN